MTPLPPRHEQAAAEIISLFDSYGDAAYDGEPVTQTAHAIQCAMLAMENLGDISTVLGALLHDIGHLLCAQQPVAKMDGFGVVNHESIGAAYLRQKGFSERVCAMVEHHVAAKRYLVYTDEGYRAKLSPASQETLRWQGGPMSKDEAAAFAQHPYFADIIKVRRWDEASKEQDAALLPVTYFRKLITDHLLNRCL